MPSAFNQGNRLTQFSWIIEVEQAELWTTTAHTWITLFRNISAMMKTNGINRLTYFAEILNSPEQSHFDQCLKRALCQDIVYNTNISLYFIFWPCSYQIWLYKRIANTQQNQISIMHTVHKSKGIHELNRNPLGKIAVNQRGTRLFRITTH